MATTKKKSSTARTNAKQKTKKTAAKTAAKAKKTPSAKTARKATPTQATKRGTAGRKKTVAAKRRPRDVPAPLTGDLTVSNGILGIATEAGFFTLARLADGGEKVQFVFQLGPRRTSEMAQAMRGLVDFLESHAADDVGGVVRCCISA